MNGGGNTSGLTFKLTADIENFTEHIGDTDAHKFKGTFDGDGKKITVSYNATADNCALFNYVDGATIQNLTVDGSITTSAKYAAGIVAQTSGATNITDCTSSVTINSTVSGDGTHGGFVGVGGGTLTITNSAFNGKLLGTSTNSCAGFVGWGGSSTVTINNSLFAPKQNTVDASGSATFSRNGAKINGGYYTQAFDDGTNYTGQGTQVYKLTANLPDGVTTADIHTFGDTNYIKTGYVTFSYNGHNYIYNDAAQITSVTLNSDKLLANGTELELSFLDTLDKEGDTYLIKSVDDLKGLATFVSNSGDTSGLTFKLTDNIVLDADNQIHIGTSDYKFKGTLDGNEHKITVNYSSTTENCALFNYVEGATIQKLTVDGSITTSAKYAAGIAAQTSGATNITDCISSVEINSTVNGDGTHGGLVAGNGGTLTITNSAFNGKLLGSSTNKCGGFVGWRSGTLNISNSLFAPAEVTIGASGSATFARNGVNSLTGGYYTQIFNDAQGGSQVYEITLPEGVTTDDAHTFGGKNYINEHSTLSYNNTLYQLDATGAVTITIDGGKLLANGTELEVSFLNTVEKDGDSYLIKSLEELNDLATYVNAGNDCAGLTFKLDADIANFTEHIGTSTTHFKGTLDGDGHKITVNYSSTTENCALFNYVEGATIQNLIVDGTINTSAKYAAGIVAQTSGTTNITDCCSSVTINSTVSGDGTHGGLVAAVVSGGTLNITNSIFNGKLLGESTNSCGGFVGYKGGTLNISNSLFAPAEVTIGTSGSATFARNGVNSLTGGYYTQIFNDAQNGTQIYTLTLPDKVSATCTNANDYEITFNGKNYYKAGATFTLTVTDDAPENMTIKGATKNKDGTYSYTLDGSAELKWLTTITWSDHTENLPEAVDGVITITTAGQLAKLAELVNGGTSYEGTTIKLANDIDLSGKLWTPIGKSWNIALKGTFDGDGHTISGLTINATTSYQGLFGYVDGGTIKNVNLTGVNVTSTKSYVGGLVGYFAGSGSIENCTVSGIVEGTDNSNQCMYIGGLAGGIYNATVKNNLVFDATVSGKYYYIGAVIGYLNNSTVSNNFYYNIADDRKGVGKFSNGSEDNGTAPAYKLTLPEGVKVMDGGVKFGDYWYVAQGATINLTAAADNQGLQSITIDGETLTSVTGIIPYKVTGDKTFTNAELGDPPITEFTAENDKTISLVSGLAETINVADSVTSFSISGNLDTDDRIIFAKEVKSLENIDGGLVANYEDGAVSIGGLTKQTFGRWRGGAKYYFDTVAGAILGTEDNKSVVKWDSGKEATAYEFWFWYPATTDEASLKANVTVDTENNVISLTPAVLNTKESNYSYIDSTKYQIVIVEDSGRTNTKAFAGGFNSPGTITNHAANMFIERSKDSWYDANDSINNTADSVTIDAGYGNDTISNSGSNVSIYGGTDKNYYGNDSPGNDVITNSGDNVTIDAGGGKDTVTNSGTNVTIDAGAGDDLIVNTAASGVSITTGDGSDVISIGADVKSFAVTDELSTNDRIVFAGGSISSLTTTEDNVVIATVGKQVVSIEGFPHVSSNEATWNRDTETNTAQYVPAIYSASLSSDNSAIIVKAEGQGEPLIELGGIVNTDAFTTDTENKIVSMPFSSSVMSGEGASILSNSAGYAVKLTGGYDVNKFYGSDEGDSITNDGNNGRNIFGGAGNDSLVDTGSQNTLHGGEGNDTLVHENSYSSDLYGEAGDDLIVIKGTGANLASHVYTGEGNDSVSIGANVQRVVLEDFSPNDKIIFEKKVASIESGALGYNDYTGITATYEDGKTVKIAGVHVPQIGEWIDGDFYNSTPQGAQVSTETIDGEEKTVITVTAAIEGTKQFELYNGGWFYNLTNNSTVDIDNKVVTFNPAAFRDASVDTTKTYIQNNSKGYQFVITNDDGTTRETKNFGSANASTYDTITNHAQNMVIDGGYGADSLINDASNVSIYGGEGNDVIELGGGSNVVINLGNGNDTIRVDKAAQAFTVEDFTSLDAIEFAESVSVENFAGSAVGFVATFADGSEISIGGVSLANYGNEAWSVKDGVRSYGKTYLAGNQLSDDGKSIAYGENKLAGNAQVAISGLTDNPAIEEGTIEISAESISGNVKVESNAGEYAFELSGDFAQKSFTGTEDADVISNSGTNLSIDGGAGNDTIINAGESVNINGGTGANSIISGGDNVTIAGGDDADDISNYGDNVTISAGAGDDSIINSGAEGLGNGSNVKIESGEGDNVIANSGASVSITAGAGADSVYNEGISATIDAGAGADSIENYGANVSIDAGDGANEILNVGNNVTINGGASADYIKNYGSNISLDGGAGDDIFYNLFMVNEETGEVLTSLDNVTVNGGEGDDSIANDGWQVSINGGVGDDYIENYGASVSIEGGAGDDSLYNFAQFDEETGALLTSPDNVTVNGGTGNDYIWNQGLNVKINAGDGADSISNAGSVVIIDAGSGENVIVNGGDSVTINGGASADYVENYGSNVSIDGGAGDDSLYNFAQFDEETEAVVTSPDNVTVNGGEGNDTIANDGANGSINGGAGDDLIINYGESATINVADGDDLISLGANVTTLKVEGFGVGDSIELAEIAPLEKIDGGVKAGGLTIAGISSVAMVDKKWSGLTYQQETIAGAKLDDKKIVYDSTSGVQDLFAIGGLKDTTGVEVDGASVILNDTALANRTDGNKVITLTDEKGGEEYKLALASDSKVKTSKESVTAGTFTASGANYVYNSAVYGDWYSVGGTSIIYNEVTDSKAYTISGLSSAASFGDNVLVEESDDKITFTFSAAALNKNLVEITGGDNVAISLASDVDTDKGTTHSEEISISDGTLNYTATNTNAYYAVNGAKVIYTTSGTSESFTLSGLKKTLSVVDNQVAGVTISGNTVTVDETALDMEATESYKVELKGGNFVLDFKGKTDGEVPATLENGEYTSAYNLAYFAGEGNEYTFKTATEPTTFKINGLGEGAKLGENVKVNDNVVEISSGALSETHDKISLDGAPEGYSLSLTDSLAMTVDYDATESDGVYSVKLAGVTKAGYKLVGDAYEWQAKSGGETLTIEGLAGGKTLTADMFTRDDNGGIVFNPTQELLPDNPATITVSEGVIDTSLLSKNETVTDAWSGTAYISTKTTSAWTSGASSVTYATTDEPTELFRLEGVKTVNDDMINGNTVTVDKANLADNAGEVKLITTGDYTLELTGVTTSKPATTTTAKFGSVSDDGKATYTQTATTDEYWAKAADNKSYTFVEQDVQTTDLFTLEGVKTVNDDMINGNTVTVDKANLEDNAGEVKLITTGDYTLELTGVTTSKPATTTTATFGTVSDDGKATYTQTATTDEYWAKAADNKSYTFVEQDVQTTDLFTLEGVKTVSDDMINGNTVTVDKANLADGATSVKLTGDYTLELTGVTTSKPATTTTAKFGSVSDDGKATYTQTATTDEYWAKAADNKSYTFVNQDVQTTDLFTLSGIKSTKSIAVDTSKKTVTLKTANLNNKDVTFSANAGGYAMALNSDVDTTKENISKWTTLSSGNVAYLKDGSGSYYSLNAKKTAVTYNASVAGANKIELSGVKGTLTLSGSTVKLTANNFNSNVKVASNAGGYSLALSGDFKNKTFTGTTGADKINSSGSNLVIIGGSGNDTVTLGSNNTFLYAKGDGNDILYSFGNDDKIKLTGTTKATPSVSGKDVIITTDGGKITVKNAAQGNVVKIVNDKDSVLSAYTYSADRIVDGKSVTLTSAFKGKLDAKNYTKVDGSGATNAITIIGGSAASNLTGGSGNDSVMGGKANDKLFGNAGNDTLVGGDGADTLSGGAGDDKLYGNAGNDSLTGGKGKDTFVFSGGKDTITDYTAGEDNISVSSSLGKGKFSVSGKNVIMTYGTNTLTITNGLGKKITVNDSTATYKKDGIYNSDNTAITLPGATKTFDASAKTYSKIVTVDGSAVSSTIKITGNGKANVLTAGANGSTLSGGKAKDTLNGGAGNDSLSGGADNDKLFGNAGKDTLVGGDGADTLSGGAGNDKLYGNAGNDSLTGGKGKDTFVFSGGKDTITDYTAGEDKVSVSSSLGKGKFSVSGKNVIMTYGTNTLTITNGLGKKITVNDSTATYKKDGIFSSDNTAVTLPGATKTFDASAKTYSKIVTVDGSAVSSTIKITGNGKANVLTAGANGSTLSGGKAKDTLNGGAGNDSLSGGADNDKLFGNAGNDTLVGGDGADTLSGGAGDDKLYGNAGNDSLTGGKGKDTFVFSGGKDTITDYTAGDDKVSVSSSLGKGKFSVSGKNVIMTYGTNTLTITNGLGKKITVNDSTATYKKDGIFSSDNTAITLPGATKTFDASAKTYSKIVTVDGSAVSSTIKITGNGKANVLTAGANGSTLSGGKAKDTLNGGAGNDSLSGGADNDKLYGNAGKDTLVGGDGADTLSGGAGDDKLYGNAGNDSLWGGAGNDSLYGGAGNDIFVYKPNEGTDTIFDYSSGDMLKILKKNGKEGGTFTKSKFSGGDLTLTISGGGTIVFDNVSKSDKFNINNKTYTIKGTALK